MTDLPTDEALETAINSLYRGAHLEMTWFLHFRQEAQRYIRAYLHQTDEGRALLAAKQDAKRLDWFETHVSACRDIAWLPGHGRTLREAIDDAVAAQAQKQQEGGSDE